MTEKKKVLLVNSGDIFLFVNKSQIPWKDQKQRIDPPNKYPVDDVSYSSVTSSFAIVQNY